MIMKSSTIYFVLVQPGDAAFIHALRINKDYNQYLSYVDDELINQQKWLIEYKKREECKQEYYYIIHRIADDVPIGTVRIYDFLEDKNSFSWGSWILNKHKTRYSALESALLVYDFAFLVLSFKQCHMVIRKQNIKVLEFHKKFGVEITAETETDYIGNYSIEKYLLIKEDIKKVIEKNNNIQAV